MTKRNRNLSSLFSAEQILCSLPEIDFEGVVYRLLELIGAADPSVAVDLVYRHVRARERCGVWLIHPRVAVVHARCEGMSELRVAVATSDQGIVCSSEDRDLGCEGGLTDRVNIVVLMLAPAGDPVSYLRAVAALTSAFQSTDILQELSGLEDAQCVWEVFDRSGISLADHVRTRDIMRSDFPRLWDTEKVCDAIDMFCREGVSELPVVDADGDLVGLVTEDELIRVCLPEYITWMEDVSSILNFEPFAEVLRRESRMPVREIMVFAERYETVDEETPAIQVAKAMVRRDVRQVLVVRDKKLVGIVSIQDFVRKILRA